MKSWRKSSYSGDNSECLEVANTLDELRDSKNPTGPTLHVDLASLLAVVQAGDLDR